METYEEHAQLSEKMSWIFLVLFSVFILGWGMLLMCMVSDAPREWDFGVLPDTPGESIFSTVIVARSSKPAVQVVPLPGALPSKVTDSGADDSVQGPTR